MQTLPAPVFPPLPTLGTCGATDPTPMHIPTPKTQLGGGLSYTRPPRALHLFSGPHNRADGICAKLREHGWLCDDVDIANISQPGATEYGSGKEAHDLTNDHLWEFLLSEVRKGEYDFVFMGTECTTFSKVRERRPGPPPLRNLDHPYGFPKGWIHPDGSPITVKQLEEARIGTYFALKSAEMATVAHSAQVGFAIENPEPSDGHISLFVLPEFVTLADLPGVRTVDFDQCPFEAETAKPTRILYYGADLSGLVGRCNHTKQWHSFQDWKGYTQHQFSAHPPLAGRRRESGELATKQAGAYPGPLNQAIVDAIIKRGRHGLPSRTGGPRHPGITQHSSGEL